MACRRNSELASVTRNVGFQDTGVSRLGKLHLYIGRYTVLYCNIG